MNCNTFTQTILITQAQLTDCTADLTAGLVCNWRKNREMPKEVNVKWETISNRKILCKWIESFKRDDF